MTILLGYFIKYLKYCELMNGVINFKGEEVDHKLPTAIYDKSSMDSEIKKKFRNVSKQFAAYHKSYGTKENISKSDETDYGIIELSDCKNDKVNYDSIKKDELIEHSLELNNSINFKDENLYKAVPLKVLRPRREKLKNQVEDKKKENPHNPKEKKFSFTGLKKALTLRENKPEKYRFSLTCSEIIKKLLCRRFLSKKGLKNVELFELAQNYLKEQLDIFGYFDIINETNKLKSILFETNQSMCLKYIENPTIYVNNKNLEPDLIDNLRLIIPTKTKGVDKKEIHQISEYFAHHIYYKKLSYADKVLLMSLDEEILSETTLKLIRIMEKIKFNKTHLIKFDEIIDQNKKEDILDF